MQYVFLAAEGLIDPSIGAGVMPVFKMAFHGCAVQFSPFDDRVAVASAQNFGIIGNGKQYVLQASVRSRTTD